MATSIQFIFCFFLIFIITTHSQAVDCIKYIDSRLAIAQNCTSTSSDVRPINATARIKSKLNSTWFGDDDFLPTIDRNGVMILNLQAESNCFTSVPTKRPWTAGDFYNFEVKCTLLSVPLEKGDLISFALFLDTHHKDDVFYDLYIPIPGYSSQKDIDIRIAQRKKIEIFREAKYLGSRRIKSTK